MALRARASGWIAAYFSAERIGHGGFSAQFYERLGLEDGAAVPDELRPHIAAGVQRAVERGGDPAGRRRRNLCLAGRPGPQCAAGLALWNASSAAENVFVQPAAGNAGTAIGAVLSCLAQHVSSERARASCDHVPRARLHAPKRSSRCSKTASCASATC